MKTSMLTSNLLVEKSRQNGELSPKLLSSNAVDKISDGEVVRDKRNPKIKEYWKMLFGKDQVLSEKELVMRILNHHHKEPTAENMTIALNKIFRDCYRQYLDEKDNHHYALKEEMVSGFGFTNGTPKEICLSPNKKLLESEDFDSNMRIWIQIWYWVLVDLEKQGITKTPLRNDYIACVQMFNNIRAPSNPLVLERNLLRLRDLFYQKYVKQK